MKATVHIEVMPKAGILDPQGKVVEESLPKLGFKGVSSVRIGRHVTLEIEAEDEAAMRNQVEAMSTKLLSNPVIEDFTYRIEA